ncbi:MAG TPA: hypothetical protein PKH77_26915 [Anaerolineae bacterium]|nr:hypothetical protein [Anaerolineae bacterium]
MYEMEWVASQSENALPTATAELQPVTWVALLNKYPEAESDDAESDDAESDNWCNICDGRGEPCRDRIINDVYDIASDIADRTLALKDLTGEAYAVKRTALRLSILAWLYQNSRSTLTHDTYTLAEDYLSEHV